MLNAICVDSETTEKNIYFVVYDACTGEKKWFRVIDFFGTIYKTESSFERTFKRTFPDRQMIFYSAKALEQIKALVYFNIIDS